MTTPEVARTACHGCEAAIRVPLPLVFSAGEGEILCASCDPWGTQELAVPQAAPEGSPGSSSAAQSAG